jgi:hypothetical protein
MWIGIKKQLLKQEQDQIFESDSSENAEYEEDLKIVIHNQDK